MLGSFMLVEKEELNYTVVVPIPVSYKFLISVTFVLFPFVNDYIKCQCMARNGVC